MTNLPTTTRGSALGKRTLTRDEVVKAQEVATTPESADYLVERIIHVVGQGMEAVVEALRKFRDYVYKEEEAKGNPWLGIPATTVFRNEQADAARKAAADLITKTSDSINFDFAISDQSEFIRGLSVEGKGALEKEMETDIDNLLDAFLAENGIVSDDKSVLYEGTEKGEIKLDENKQSIKADPEKVRELIANEKTGFKQYLKEQHIEAKVNARDYQQPASPVSFG